MTASSETMVLVGTTKGLFTLRAGDGRDRFELSGPTFAGEEIYSTCLDSRSGDDPAVHRVGEQPLGAGAAPLRRPRRDLDRGPEGGAALPGGLRRLAGADLAARPRPGRRARRAVRRRRAGGAVPQRRRRAHASRSCAGCGTTRTARSGSPAVAGCASTPCSCTPTIRTAC